MIKHLKVLRDFVKGIKVINLYQKERFIANINEETAKYLKDLCRISPNENILMVLDDSLFKNLKQVVVFTDKKIYWTTKNAGVKQKQDNTEIKTSGPGSVDNCLLHNVSVFSKTEKNVKFVFVVGENIQLIIPFANFSSENSLTLSFYDYISNYCGGYKPNNSKNESIYKKISKTSERMKVNIIARVFNGMSLVLAGLLIVNVIARYYKLDIVDNDKIVCAGLLIKLLSIIFGYKKSMYSNLLLFILTYNILTIPLVYNYSSDTMIYLIYAGVLMLLGIFDFDKIFKYSAFVLAIVSIGLMVIEYFDLKTLLRYLP